MKKRQKKKQLGAEHKNFLNQKRKYANMTLEEMLEGITPKNVTPVFDWGPPVGREVI